MEVHHHSHTARKKWTHYFWEFLMLFLAVFCGFLAEYHLEHKIEKDRIKKYMRDMIVDLLNDTAYINNRFVFTGETIKVLDSFTIVAKLSDYWTGINELKTIAERVEQRYDASQEMAYHIFNRSYFYTHGFLDSLQRDFRLFDSISHLGPMLLMTKEKKDLIAFAKIIDRVKVSIIRFRQRLLIQQRLATSLITLIREEYHFN